MKLKLLAVGRLRQKAFAMAADEYCRRLAAYMQLEILEVREGKLADRQASLLKESQALFAHVEPGDHLVLLDEGGTEFDSVGLAHWLERQAPTSLVFLVGSAYGVAPALKERANSRWALSQLTFPHELARVIVLEQLYRAATISAGHPYHHR